METLIRWILRHPRKVVAAFVLLTAGFALALEGLIVDPSLEVFIPKNHPEVVFYGEMRKVFGLSNFVLVGVVDEREGGIFHPDTLDLVKRLSEAFAEIPNVIKVVSLYEFPYIEGDEEGMTVSPLYSEVSDEEKWLRDLERKLREWPFLMGNLVSSDGKATAILVRYERRSTGEIRRQVYHQVMETVEATPAPNQEIFVAGMTAIEVCIGDTITRDLKRLLPVVYGVVILCLWLSFRRPLGVLLPLLTVTISSLWTMGLMALLRTPLNTLTSSLPVLLTAVGTAYTIHILFHFLYNASRTQDRTEALVRGVCDVGYAVIMAGLTTMGGFASLGVSQVLPIRYMGLFAAFGTGVALVCSIVLIPAILGLTMHRLRILPASEVASEASRLERFLRGYTRFVILHRRAVYWICTLVAVGFLVGTFRIYPESDYITQFKESSYIRKSDRMINRYFNGSSVLDIIVDAGEPDALKDPGILSRMEALQRFVEGLPHVGGTISLVDYLKRMNQVLNTGRPGAYSVPGSKELVAQYLLLYSMSGDETDLEDVVNDDYSMACISVFLKSGSTRYAGRLIQRIQAFNERETRLPIRLTAPAVLGKVVDELTIVGQVESIVTSTIVVFCLVAVILRSFVGGFFGILPLMLCVLINYGILGWGGIPLQAGTAIIGSIALGIGIDYAIHFLNMSRIKARREEGIEQALEATAGTAGRAIIYNAAAVGLGFLVLVFSSFIGDIYFGSFITLTMLTASFSTLTLLPCLLCTFRPRFVLRRPKAREPGAT